MNKKAAKTLKAAAKSYKEKVRQPVVVELQEEHLSVVLRALETYQRLKLGQIDIALKEAIESTFTASKDPFNADSSYEYIETHGWTHEILKFAREEIKKLEVT